MVAETTIAAWLVIGFYQAHTALEKLFVPLQRKLDKSCSTMAVLSFCGRRSTRLVQLPPQQQKLFSASLHPEKFRYKFAGEMVVDNFCMQERDRGQIEGPKKIVQVDESKFEKRKYH